MSDKFLIYIYKWKNQTDLYLSMHYYETNAYMLSKNAKQEMSISQLLRLEP